MVEIKPTVMTGVPRLFERMYNKIRRNVEKQPAKKQKIFDWALNLGQDYADLKRADECSSYNTPKPYNLTAKKKVSFCKTI